MNKMNKENVKEALIKYAIEGKAIDCYDFVSLLNYGKIVDRDDDLNSLVYDLMKTLTKIADEEYKMGHPAITCFVVQKKIGSIPGWGFYNWYSTTYRKKIDIDSFSEKKKLHDSLIAECREYWQNAMSNPT